MHTQIDYRLLCTTGTSGPAHPLLEHLFEHLLDDEIGRAHMDPFRHLAVGRFLRLRVLQHDAQRRGPKATGRIKEKTRKRCNQRGDHFHWKVIKFTIISDKNIPLDEKKKKKTPPLTFYSKRVCTASAAV